MRINHISDREFSRFQAMIFDSAGITLSDNKKSLVVGRLAKRLEAHQLGSYGEYMDMLLSGNFPDEQQIAVDLLTTNETYFFREPKHFEFLKSELATRSLNGSPFRVWSAACSSGQEAYSIAMLLDNELGNRRWEIVATDISTKVLDIARQGIYPMSQSTHLSKENLIKYCLKGIDDQEGKLLVDSKLRNKVKFMHANLNKALPRVGEFDFIFLRNVMIYFDVETKRSLIERLRCHLKPDGYLLVGHSESLNGVSDKFRMISPSIYQRIDL